MRFWMKRMSESKICSMLLNTAEQPWPELCDPELLVMNTFRTSILLTT